jgi:hypothetical protein
MWNLEKCPECLQRFHVEWQGKSSQKGISLMSDVKNDPTCNENFIKIRIFNKACYTLSL